MFSLIWDAQHSFHTHTNPPIIIVSALLVSFAEIQNESLNLHKLSTIIVIYTYIIPDQRRQIVDLCAERRELAAISKIKKNTFRIKFVFQ